MLILLPVEPPPEVPPEIRFMLAVDVLLTGVALALLFGEGGGLPALVLGLQGDAGGDVFGGVGGISS